MKELSKKCKNLARQKFGKLIALEPARDVNGDIKKSSSGGVMWKCTCECGGKKEVSSSSLNMAGISSCGKCNYEDLSSRKFGKITALKIVIDEDGVISKNNKHIMWWCICECGVEKKIQSGHLKSGNTKSCGGCSSYENFVGKKFDKLIVLKTAKDEFGNIKKSNCGHIIWECRCECGRKNEVSSGSLNAKRIKSCGKCRHNISEQKFGKLIALEKAANKNGDIKKNSRGGIMWKCICECGAIKEVVLSNLRSGRTKSCGCIVCSKYMSQNSLCSIVKKILQEPSIERNYKQFNWLCNPKTKYNLEIDIYLPELKVAIEYDGEQHFRPIRFGGISIKRAEENFIKQRKFDRLKNRLIKKHIKNNGQDIKYFIRFDYKEPLTEEYIRAKLIKKGVLGESRR